MKWLVRDWTKIRPDSLQGRILRLPLRVLPRNRPLGILSGPCKGMKWVIGANIYSCWFGTYEIEKQNAFYRFLHQNMTVYDIGANAGYYTLMAANRIGSGGHVYSFEPLPSNIVNLRIHLQANAIQNATVVETAVSNYTGSAQFDPSVHNSQGKLIDENSGLTVPTITLDEFVSQGHPVPDLVKMDVEGAEGKVLEGARMLLSKGKTTWFIALHGDEPSRQCDLILKRNGYRLYSLKDERLANLINTDEIYALPAGS